MTPTQLGVPILWYRCDLRTENALQLIEDPRLHNPPAYVLTTAAATLIG
jgi:hypothetical protein